MDVPPKSPARRACTRACACADGPSLSLTPSLSRCSASSAVDSSAACAWNAARRSRRPAATPACASLSRSDGSGRLGSTGRDDDDDDDGGARALGSPCASSAWRLTEWLELELADCGRDRAYRGPGAAPGRTDLAAAPGEAERPTPIITICKASACLDHCASLSFLGEEATAV